MQPPYHNPPYEKGDTIGVILWDFNGKTKEAIWKALEEGKTVYLSSDNVQHLPPSRKRKGK